MKRGIFFIMIFILIFSNLAIAQELNEEEQKTDFFTKIIFFVKNIFINNDADTSLKNNEEESIFDSPEEDSFQEDKIEEEIVEIPMPTDYSITVEGETGKLSDAGQYTSVGESTRGKELYLGDGKAKAEYEINSEYEGDMELYAYLNDDGKHSDGSRDANFIINEKIYSYKHISKDLTCKDKNYAWIHIGKVQIIKGKNIIIIEKLTTTSAAFVMNKFELTNIEKIETPCCEGITDDLGNKCVAEHYSDYLEKDLLPPYFNECSDSRDWFKGTNAIKYPCDDSFKKCYESCSGISFYNVCDMLCLDEGYDECYDFCSPVKLDTNCDNKCD